MLPPMAKPAMAWMDAALCGRQRQTRRRVQQLGGLCGLSCVAWLLLLIGFLADLVPGWAAATTVGWSLAVAAILYALARSSLTANWSDARLAYWQLMLASSAVVLSYGLVDLARGAALQILCLLLAFEMGRLSQQRLWRASLISVGLLALTSLARLWLLPGSSAPSDELYTLVMSAVLLPVAIMVGGEVGRLHDRQSQQREELATAFARMSELSVRDGLTGLANRRHLMALLDEVSHRQARSKLPFAVAVLDIDWFKRINDSHGHAAGDAVLRQFAVLAQGALPAEATLARWGGEEFMLLLPGSSCVQALAAVEVYRQRVCSHEWSAVAPDLAVTFSAGVAEWAAPESTAELIARADRALYLAKQTGRNRCCVDSAPHTTGAAPDVDDTGVGSAAHAHAPAHAHALALRVAAQLSAQALLSAGRPAMQKPEATNELPHRPAQGASDRTPARNPSHPMAPPAAAPPLPTQATQAMRTMRLMQWLVDLVTSTDPAIREPLRLPLMAAGLYAVWIVAVLAYAIPAGHIGRLDGVAIVLVQLICMATFYALIRSGRSARARDPALVLPQMLAAMAIAAYGYTVAPSLRPSILHLMCVIQVFGMATLTPRESRIAGGAGVGVLLGVWLILMALGEPGLIGETLKLALAIFIVGRLEREGRRFSQLREAVRQQQTQLAQALDQVRELVIRDALTGLFNRQHMQALLQRECESFRRTGQRFSVALIDVDHFKRVNDEHGHHVGDRLLQGMAESARRVLRESDVICRWGGEEFLVLMRDTGSAAEGLQALARLRRALALLDSAGGPAGLTVTFSAGLASCRHSEPLDTLIERADRALYAAKSSGRNRDMLSRDEPLRVMSPVA